MNEATQVKNGRQTPPPITAEELDAKFDAGEDVSEYFNWENAVVVPPGEMSPRQKLSVIDGMLEDLLRNPKMVAHLSPLRKKLSVSLSALALAEIGREAAHGHVSREELVQSWIEQKLAELKDTK